MIIKIFISFSIVFIPLYLIELAVMSSGHPLAMLYDKIFPWLMGGFLGISVTVSVVVLLIKVWTGEII